MDGARIRSTAVKARSTADKARNTARAGVDTASDRWPPVRFAVESWRRFVNVNGAVMAGHLTVRLFLVIVPVTLVAVAALGYASASGTDLQGASEGDLRFTTAMADVISSTGRQASDARLQALLVGLSALLFAGMSLVKALRLVFATIWRLPIKTKASLPAVLGSVLVLFFILLITIGINRRLSREGLIATGVGALVLIISGTLTIVLLTWQLPRRPTGLRDLLPGALTAGLGFAALNTGAAWYFTRKLESTTQVYGTFGVAMTMLTYLFLWSEVLVLAGVVDTVWYDHVLHPGGDGIDAGPVATGSARLAVAPAAAVVTLPAPAEDAPATPPGEPTPEGEPEPQVEVEAEPAVEVEASIDGEAEPEPAVAGARPRGDLVRRIVTVPLAVITAILVVASAVTVWSHYILLNSDGWQSTVVPLLEDPDIRAQVGDELAGQIVAAVDVQGRARSLLSDRAQVLAPAISSGVESFIDARVREGLASPEVQQLWAEANARLHPKVVAFLRGEQVGGVSTSDGAVTLDLLPVMSRVLARIDQRAPGLLTQGRPVPAIDASVPEDQARAQLAQALGVTLPEGFGVITLPRSDRLADVQRAVQIFDRMTVVLPLVTLALAIALFALAPNRRRAAIWFGATTLVLAAAVLSAIRVGRNALIDGIEPPDRQRAVGDALVHVLASLRTLSIVLLAMGVVLALVSVLTGERMRARILRGVTEVRHLLDGRGPLVATVVAGVVAFLVVVWLIVASPTPVTFLLALAVLFLCGVVIARRQITDAVTGLDLPTVGPAGTTGRPPPPVAPVAADPGDTGPHTETEHD